MRCSGVSPAASVSPLVKPVRISFTLGEGDLRVLSFKWRPVVDDWPDSARGGGVGLVLKRGSIVGGLAVALVVSLVGICHEPSLARSSISLTVCGGSFRFEKASSTSSLGRRFCHKRMRRCAPEPHLGALRTVDGPHHSLDVCGERGSDRGVLDKSDSALLGRSEVMD